MEWFYDGVVSCLRIALSTFWYDKMANAGPRECNRGTNHDMFFCCLFLEEHLHLEVQQLPMEENFRMVTSDVSWTEPPEDSQSSFW